MKKQILTLVLFSAALALPAENLLHNSSFELGSADFSLLRLSGRQSVYRPPVIDRREKIHGGASLKIENPDADCIQFVSREFPLKAGEFYTFSWYLKSSAPLRLRAAVIGEAENKWQVFKNTRIEVSAGGWKRYTFTVRTLKAGWYFAELRWGQLDKVRNTATVNLDALMVNPGRQAAGYAPLAEAEFSLTAPNLRLAADGKPFPVTFSGVDYTGKGGTVPLLLTLRDRLSGKTVSTQAGKLELSGTEMKSQTFRFLPEKNGLYEIGSDRGTISIGFGKVSGLPAGKIDPRRERSIGADFDGSCTNPAWMSDFPVVFSSCGCTLDEVFQFAAASGLKMLRVGNTGDWDGGAFSWRKFEPEEGKFDFSLADGWLQAADRHGMNLMPVLGNMFYLRDNGKYGRRSTSRMPQFVVNRAKRIPGKWKWDDLEIENRDYQRVSQAMATRFKGKIPAYELSNEPNICMRAEKYAELSRIAAETIHCIDPAALVVGGCITEDYDGRSAYVKTLVEKEAVSSYDVLSFHPYRSRLDSSAFPAREHIGNLRRSVEKVKPGLPLWNSELYYLCDAPDRKMQSNDRFQRDNALPEYLVRRLTIDFGEGVMQSMPLHFWMLQQKTPDLQPHWHLDCNYVGMPLVPGKLFIAQNNAARFFTGCTPLEKYDWPAGYTGYRFRRRDGVEFSVVWCHPGKPSRLIHFSGKRFDLFGNPLPEGKTAVLTRQPEFILGKVTLAAAQ